MAVVQLLVAQLSPDAKKLVDEIGASPELANKLASVLSESSSANPWVVVMYWFILVLAGAFGGFVSELDPKDNFRLRRFRWSNDDNQIELGWVGAVLIGVAAAIGIMLVGDTFGVLRMTGFDPIQLMRLAALGVIAGYVGHSLLGGLGQKIKDIAEKQVEERTVKIQTQVKEDVSKEVLKISEVFNNADRLLQNKKYEQAKTLYQKADQLFPEQRLRARKGIANCLAYLGREREDRELLSEADKTVSQLVADFPNDPDVAYNAMWTRVLIHELERKRGLPPTYSVEQLRNTLDRAIELDPESKRWARHELDLEPLIEREPSIAEILGAPLERPEKYKWREDAKEYHRAECPLAQGGEWKEGSTPPAAYSPCKKCMPA